MSKAQSVDAQAGKPAQTKHTFVLSQELKHQILRNKFGNPKGGAQHNSRSVNIVEENDAIARAGGIKISNAVQTAAVHDNNDDDGVKKKNTPSENNDDDFFTLNMHPAKSVACPPCSVDDGDASSRPYYELTQVCVVNADTVSAAVALAVTAASTAGSDPNSNHHSTVAALNFANESNPGGYYRAGAHAQEEDLCRLLPQLYPSLALAKESKGAYPIPPGTALVTAGCFAVRDPASYDLIMISNKNAPPPPKFTVITAAMPRGGGDKRPKGGWVGGGSDWERDVTHRIRSVLHASRVAGCKDLVLGAFGCGAFGNPSKYVATIFQNVLKSAEFRGSFERVVFAIVDPVGTGNLKPFVEVMSSIGE